ncbi:MAG: adenylyltransferase/cytidyltransferase family protein [Flavobacteriales bacterium]|nr:adenylyltransferase/cytidyltransferase family protein [Flavobacteriales bacterium]
MIRGFACGVFDLYHPGHVLMLRDCKKHCDHLTVALNTASNIDRKINPDKREPVFSLEERILVMESVKYVDCILQYSDEDELTEMMKTGKYDLRFLGEDYRGKPITAPGLVAVAGLNSRNTSCEPEQMCTCFVQIWAVRGIAPGHGM